jgi:hypothetical protein
MEEHKATRVFIFAGHSDEMKQLLESKTNDRNLVAHSLEIKDYE